MDGVLSESLVWEKIAKAEAAVHLALSNPQPTWVPPLPARDAQNLPVKQHPPKKSLSEPEGQARLLHDLASIELQAFELGLRTLHEFPNAPAPFRNELAALTINESEHLKMCLEGLESLGFSWGQWPVHTGLWESTDSQETLLDRIVIVHRYLEGSGLDAADSILRKLGGVSSKTLRSCVQTIHDEEIGHVEFGSRWYRALCKIENIDPEEDFEERLKRCLPRLPRRREPVAWELRKQAGFSTTEIQTIINLREYRWTNPSVQV